MNTSRLGKLVVILLGSIGLLYIGGGNAHADAVSISSKSANNVASTSNNISSDQTSASLVMSVGSNNDQNNTTPSGTGSNDQTTSTTGNGTAGTTHQDLTSSPNFEIDGSNSAAIKAVNSTDPSNSPDGSNVSTQSVTAPISPVVPPTPPVASHSSYSYHPERLAPTIASTERAGCPCNGAEWP